MFSFRKIINTLVLISYVKMTIISSFAMDSVVLPTLTTKLKVMPAFREDGKLDHMTLNIIEKDSAAGTRRVVNSKTVYNPNLLRDPRGLPDMFMGWIRENNSIEGFKWDLKELGIIRVDFHGNVFLDSALQSDPTKAFKVSGANAIVLHNCNYYHLITKSEGLLLLGGNTLHNLVATLTNPQSGIVIHNQSQKDTLGNITLTNGSMVNTASPDVMDGAVWNLGGGDFNNEGTLNLKGRHDIIQAHLVENKSSIHGGDLHIETKEMINDGTIQTRKVDAKVSGNFANIKTIETEEDLTLNIKGEGASSGRLKSKGSLKVSAETRSFINDGEIQADTYSGENVENHGRIKTTKIMNLTNGANYGTIYSQRGPANISGTHMNYGSFHSTSITGNGELKSKGVLSTNRLSVRTFEDLGSTLLGEFLIISSGCETFKTHRQTLIDVAELIIERHENNTARLLDGVIQAKKLSVYANTEILGILDTDLLESLGDSPSIQTTPLLKVAAQIISIRLHDSAKVRIGKTILRKTGLLSSGTADLGLTELYLSTITNTAQMLLVLAKLSSCRAQPIQNSGMLQTEFDGPHSWVLSNALDNQNGTLRIKGSYTPVYDKDGVRHTDSWNGKVIVDDTMVLPGTTEAMDPELFTNFAVNKLIIEGHGAQFSDLARTQDWTFADHIIFQNFDRLWFFRSNLTLNNPQFVDIGSLKLGAILNIAKGTVSGRNIGEYSMGANNDYLGELKIADGGMDLEVDQDVDIRFGKIEMRQDGHIKSKTGKILVGEEGAKADVKAQVYGPHINNPNYIKKYLNGSYVKSHGKLKLEAKESDILVHYGQVLSVGGTEFVVKDLIKNLSGVIMSYGDITLRGKRYLQTRPDQSIFTADKIENHRVKWWSFEIKVSNGLHLSLEISDPAQLSTFGQLVCHLDSFRNHYSDVLVAKSLLWNGIEQSIKNADSSIENLSRPTYTTPTIATMKVGEDLVVVGGSVSNSGSINARTIDLDLDSFTSGCLRGRSRTTQFGTLKIDISKIIEDAKNDPAAAAFMGETCLEGDEIRKALGGVNPDYILYRVYTELTGRAYLKLTNGQTISGFDLVKFLEKNGRHIAQGLKEKITALVLEQIEINQRFEPRISLFISPDDINPKQGSGDVTGEKVHIKTKGDQTYTGGSVHAETTTILESEGDINASNTSISGDDGVAASATNIKAETLAHRIYHACGYTDIVQDDMRLTSKYGPVRLISAANMILNGTLVSGASIGVKAGGTRQFGTTELHSESTTYWKKHVFHEERTDHFATHLHAHGNIRPEGQASSSASAQADPAPKRRKKQSRAPKTAPRGQAKTSPQETAPFNPNRTEYEGGVTVEDVDPAEYAPSARKPYHPNPEFIRTTEPSGYTWDEAAYKAVPQLKSALKNPRRAQLKKGQKRTVRFEEPELTFTPEDVFADSPEAGNLDVETDGDSLDYGVVKEAAGDSTGRTHGTGTQAAATSRYSRTDTKKSKKWGRTKKKETKHQSGRPNVCTTTAGNIATEEGDEGLNLYGSHIKAKRINLTSKQGRINLLTALGYDYVSMKKQSKDAAWQSTSQSVAYHENRQFCRFQTEEEEGLIIKAADGICVEFVVEKYSHTEATDGKKPRTTEHSRLKDLPTAPGYEWLHEMDKRDDIIRIYVDERHDTMYMHQEGLSAVAKIVISIIMSCISGGTLGILTAIMTNLTINTIEARGDPVEGAKRTFSKEGLKAIGRSYVGRLLIGGDSGGIADGATWLANLQNAFMESLNTTLSDYLGRGIVDGDWRVNARRIGLDLLTSTAARFGAKQIGGWRQGTILGGDFMDYVSHKIMHGALAAATSAATARLDHVKGPERRKRIMGAASGAMIAEAVGEYMMHGALAKVEAQLNASGHAPTSQAYADLRTKLMSDELRQIKMFAQLAVAASAEAMRFDLNAAMFAANNALENDATRVFLALDRARVESQIQKILERDLAGKFYKGRGSSEQARAAIGDALRQQGATEEQINQVLSGKVGRLIDATDVFHKDWLKADRTGDGLSFCGKLNDPSYLAKGLNLMSAAALALDECAREHPQLTQLTLSSIELAMGGVAGYVRTRVGDAVGLNDYVDGKIHQAESWLSGQLEGSLGMSAQKADMLASAGTFGMMFGFAGVVGNAKDKILKKAEDVTGKVKVYMTYFKDHPKGGVPYTGRTSGMVRSVDDLDGIERVLKRRDANHHMNKSGFGRAELDKATLNPRAARGREQSNIDGLGGARSTGGTSSNKINSVSGKNPKKGLYEQARKQEFGE